MHARWVVAVALASGCWTSAPPPHVAAPPPAGPSACKVVGNGHGDAHVSAAAGDAPFLVGFSPDKVIVEIARGADANSWLPLDLRHDRMTVRGVIPAGELELYLRLPRMIADVIVVGGGQRLKLTRGMGDAAEVSIGLPASVRLVEPSRARPWVKCSELSAFVASSADVVETLGFTTENEPYQFAAATMPVTVLPGGPEVATFDTKDRTAYPIEKRGPLTRVWVTIAEADDLAVVGWVPTASLVTPPGMGGGGTGWGTIGAMGKPPRLRHCADKVIVSLVRDGTPGRVTVGEIAADADIEIGSDPDMPPGTVPLGKYTIGWLSLAEGAHLVIPDGACVAEDQNRSPSSGP